MSQKKCPKCGESNPVEAVMCWACYTPLAGAPASVVAAGRVPAPTDYSGDSEKSKKAIPAWQIGVIGLGLLGVAFIGTRTLTSDTPTETETEYSAPARSPDNSPSRPVVVSPSTTTGVSPSAPSIVPAPPPVAGQQNYTVSVPPRAGIPWGTMAIVPIGNVAPQAAASMAAAACKQTMQGGKWDGLYVYVFTDADSARQFRNFQSQSEGAPIEKGAYSSLRELWPKTLVRYEYSRGYEAVRYPSLKPDAWWYGNSPYRRAQF